MAKIKNVFNFLKDYNEIRNPVITDIEKQIWNYKLSNLPSIKELWSIFDTNDFDNLKILEIERPSILQCPPPDDNFRDWINKSWDKLNIKEINYIESKVKMRIDENEELIEEIEYFMDDKGRLNSYNTWIEKRNTWLETEGPKELGLKFYNELFSLYSSFKREAESLELVLGDGLISWTTEGKIINHPVLLQKVNLEFNSNKPSFIINCDEIKTEIYTPMLRVIKSINQTMLSEIIKEVEEQNFHIADKNNNIEIFKKLINVINESGKYIEDNVQGCSIPTIIHKPILFARKRNLGFAEFINKIIEDLDDKEDIALPDFFENLLGNYRENITNTEVVGDSWNQNGIDEEILLTLPANNEQMRIVKYLDNYGAVLVQGPPGTGKTHTIANLIGHLLSRGDSVLVTSHTEKALTVLKEKVYKELQSLCISLLSSSSERKEMDATLFEIAEKSTSLDKNESLRRINRLEKQRKELIELHKEKKAELLQVRSLEYKDIVYGNTTVRPIDAAKFIREGENTLNFIPGKTTNDTILFPLSLEEIEYLYSSNGLIDRDEERILHLELPNINNIWTDEKLRHNTEKIIKYRNKIKGWTSDFVFRDDITENELLESLNELQKLVYSIDKMDDFTKSIINKSIFDNMYSTFWNDIFQDFDNLKLDYEDYRKVTFYNNYNIPNDLYCIETINILDEIICTEKEIPVNFMISIVKPKWKKVRDSISNNRRLIEKRQEYEEVKLIISYTLKKEEIINRINKLNFELTKKKIENNETEEKIEIILEKVKSSLNWYQRIWVSFINKIENLIQNFHENRNDIQISTENAVESIYDLSKNYIEYNINNYYFSLLLNRFLKEREDYLCLLKKYTHYGEPFEGLIDSVENNNINSYNTCYTRLVDIYSKSEINNKRYELLEKLEKYAPEWSRAIKNREEIHGEMTLQGNIELAWKWRQLSNQLDKLDTYDLNKILKEVEKNNEMLMKNAKELAYEKAWYKKIINNTQEQTQAIEGWRQTMRQIGRGYGRTAPMLREKARQLMPLCQTAIPVWIMPLNRVAENFDPKRNKFDVIIIDEASQADILALSALYLGKKIIIVGDDEQVSPESVGIKVDEITALTEQHLQEIPNNHLFNGRTSIYDIAKTSGFKPIMLVEHFRCLPEIIEFSNQLSYNGKIKPLRDASGVGINPAVIEYRVPKGYRNERKVNPVEAEHIASLICSCIEDEAFKKKTIGVISLLGSEQAYEIDRILQTRLEPKEYEYRKIQCGTSAQFQGDERDIIFLSLVDGPKEGGGPLRLLSQDGNNDINRKRYNVAASRAKDQMWVVHSLNPEIDLQAEDLRLRLIKHATNPKINRDDEILSKTESDFEFRVMKDLLNKGYKVYPQWQVGAYRIDMVVEDGDKRIALECDGEKWHAHDELANDLKRQAILERLGWRFIRIRGSEFYRNPEGTMKWVYDELENNNIGPNFHFESEKTQEEFNNELLNKIKVRAQELRQQWNEEQDELELQKGGDVEEGKDDSEEVQVKDNYEEKNISLEKGKLIIKEKNDVRSVKIDQIFESRITETDLTKSEEKSSSSVPKPLFDFRS